MIAFEIFSSNTYVQILKARDVVKKNQEYNESTVPCCHDMFCTLSADVRKEVRHESNDKKGSK